MSATNPEIEAPDDMDTTAEDPTVDTPATESTPTDDTGTDDNSEATFPKKDRDIQRLKKESAKHRVALRATEEQLTEAQNTITALQTQMIEEQLSETLQAPKLFWALGNEVADFLTDTGQINREKVTKAAKEAAAAGLTPVRRSKGSANGGYRENGTPPAPTTWAGIR